MMMYKKYGYHYDGIWTWLITDTTPDLVVGELYRCGTVEQGQPPRTPCRGTAAAAVVGAVVEAHPRGLAAEVAMDRKADGVAEAHRHGTEGKEGKEAEGKEGKEGKEEKEAPAVDRRRGHATRVPRRSARRCP